MPVGTFFSADVAGLAAASGLLARARRGKGLSRKANGISSLLLMQRLWDPWLDHQYTGIAVTVAN